MGSESSANAGSKSFFRFFPARVACVIFISAFGLLEIAIIAFNRYEMDALLLAFTTALSLGCLFGAWQFLRTLEISDRMAYCALAVFCAATGAALIYCAFSLRYTPLWDMGELFDGASDWVLKGNFGSHAKYFATFSNNIGALLLMRCVFTVARFLGFNDFYAALIFYNAAASIAGVAALFCAARSLGGNRAAVMSLAMLGAFPIYYIMGANLYTDVLSMPFGIIGCSLYLRVKASGAAFRPRFAAIACAGLAIAVGTLIKATIAIVLVAIILDVLLTADLQSIKRLAAPLIVASCVCIALTSAFKAYMDWRIGPEMLDRERLPLPHWVMMGVGGDGSYSGDDYYYSKKVLPDMAARREEIPKAIRRRVEELGFSGLIRLFGVKLARDFGDGTYNSSYVLDDEPVNDSPLHALVLNAGKHHDAFKHICTGMLCALQICAVIGAIRQFRRPSALAMHLSLMGLYIFLMFWESSSRYSQNFMPILILAAVSGFSEFNDTRAINAHEAKQAG
ncbi:MAG: glycosyltransferase family 39 protein [Clostridiales bacterium]|jgi:hypothetical protein|nr:glycosyltransferase family 39 protein [Clostridiales bacterium]